MQFHRLVLSLLAAASVAGPARAVVSDDLVWRRSQSPVVLGSPIVVDRQGSLTIEPGVEIRLHEQASIVVQGRLVAIGAPGSPIRFTGLDAARPWGGLRVEGGEAFVHDAEITGAREGLVAAGGATSLRSVVVASCSADGVRVRDGARLRMLDSTITGCGGAGLVVEGSSPEIRRCRFVSNADAVIVSGDGFPAGSDNTATGHRGHDAVVVTGTAIASATAWSDVGLPVAVPRSLSVEPGAELRIPSGVDVSFGAEAVLAVSGSLVVDAGAAHAVRMGGEPGWSGVVVRDGGTASLRGLRLRGARVGVDVEDGGSASLALCDVSESSSHALRVAEGGSARASLCAFHDGDVGVESAGQAWLGDATERGLNVFACNRVDVVNVAGAVLTAVGNAWTGPTVQGDVDLSSALSAIPSEMGDFQEIRVSKTGDEPSFDWTTVASCARHSVLSSGSPAGPFDGSGAAQGSRYYVLSVELD